MQSKKKVLFECSLFVWIILNGIYETRGKVNQVESLPNQHTSPEKLKDYLTKLLSENISLRACPAPRLPVDENDCKQPICKKDDDCGSRNQSCCFNGCVFTCVDRISPPPVIDWDEEPDSPSVRKEGAAVVRCTTSPRPAPSEPVGCPKGYACRIDDYGDPLEGRFSSGICVPESSDVSDNGEGDPSGLEENTRKQTVYLPGGCVLSEDQYKHMQDFMTRSYVVDCLCVEGSVECRVSEKKS